VNCESASQSADNSTGDQATVDEDSEDMAHANRWKAYIFNKMEFDPHLGLIVA